MGTIHYLNNHLDKFRETKITITLDDLEGFANYDNLNKPDKKIVKLFIECFKNKEDYFSFQNKLPKNIEKIGLYRLVANYWVAYVCYYYNDEFEEILSKCLLKIRENVILLESPHFCKKVFYYLNELKKVVQLIDKKKYKRAIDFTYNLHLKQMRKGTSIPYFSHLISVSNNIIENNGNTDEAIAGLLHDAVEDQGGEKTLNLIKKKFGIKVAKIVSDCTDTDITPKPPWYERKKNYIKNLQYKSQSSLFVSMCDKTHNATCIINDYKRVGKKLWKRFSAKPKQILWYYESLGKCYFKNLKHKKVLIENYKNLLKEMKKITK